MKTLYKNFNLLDGTNNMTLKPNMELLVENDTITKIAESIEIDEAVTIPGGHMEGTVAYGAKDDADFVRFIEENISYGVDWIKIMITGGVLDAKVKGGPGEMRMTPEQVKLCCDTAHAHGVKVCAHVESPAGVVAAIDNGVDSVEHGSELHDEEIKILKERDGALICTLSPAVILARLSDKYTKASEIVIYNSEVLMQQMITGTKTALENDIKVGLGTDTGCPFVTHYDMWRELEYAHRMLEIPREEALYLGTLSNATILGIENETGSVEVGKKADFIVSRENPMEDFRALSQLELVVFEGKEIPNPKPEKFPECEKALDELLNVI